MLFGSGGPDLFRFDTLNDLGDGATRDVIADFGHGSDRIDLSPIDADPGAPCDQAFLWIGNGAFGNIARQVRFFAEGGNTIIAIDVNGDGTADRQIELTGLRTLTAAQFDLKAPPFAPP